MINIVVSVNKKYIEPLKTMLFSLRMNNKADILVWFLNSSLDEDDLDILQNFLGELDVALKVVAINHSEVNRLPIVDDNLFSIETYYRLLIPWVLPEEVERALWLDADIIINRDITDFYNTDLTNNCLVVCADSRQLNEATRNADRARLGLNDTHCYFNAGVLLMNLLEIRKRTSWSDVLGAAEKLGDKLKYQDQDVLNFLFQGSVIYHEHISYNCNSIMYNNLDRNTRMQVSILHYYYPIKPWSRKTFTDADMQYWNVRRSMGMLVILPYVLNFLWKYLRKNRVLKKLYIKVFR